MSLTPKDGPDGRGESRARSGDRGGDRSLRARVGSALAGLLGRAGMAVARLVSGGSRRSAPTADEASDPHGGRRSEPLPVRSGSTPPRSHRSAADLVAEREDGHLTIRDPDDPDARIRSDTWTRVEP